MPTDLDRLQGTWNVITLELDGQQIQSGTFNDARIVVTKTRVESLGMGGTYEGTLEIDETKKPKALDLAFTAGHAVGTRNKGIYKFDGERWTICLATTGGIRPKKFATMADTGLALETLEKASVDSSKTKRMPRAGRSGAESSRRAGRAANVGSGTRGGSMATAKSDASAASQEGPTGLATELEGEWAMVEAVFNGSAMAANMVEWCKRITRGNVTTVLAGAQVMLKASFTLGSSKNPREIGYMNLVGSNRGKAQEGIAELNGESLRICMSAPGKPRPREFSSKKGDGRSYTTWRRLKK